MISNYAFCSNYFPAPTISRLLVSIKHYIYCNIASSLLLCGMSLINAKPLRNSFCVFNKMIFYNYCPMINNISQMSLKNILGKYAAASKSR